MHSECTEDSKWVTVDAIDGYRDAIDGYRDAIDGSSNASCEPHNVVRARGYALCGSWFVHGGAEVESPQGGSSGWILRE